MIKVTTGRALRAMLTARYQTYPLPPCHSITACLGMRLADQTRFTSTMSRTPATSPRKQALAGDEPLLSTPEPTSPHPDSAAPPSVILRPYQQQAIDACLTALAAGKRRIGVSSPTGSGKTTMFMHLIPQVPCSRNATDAGVKEGNQVLVLVGSVELALQAEAAAKRILDDGYTVEVEQSKRVARGYADVTIATYQTISNPLRLEKFDPSRFKLVIVDEAHHAAALSYMRLLHYFNEDVQIPSSTEPFSKPGHGNRVPIIGFSATFSRHDQLALSAVFEEIVFHREVGQMLGEGWLSPVKATAVYADLNLDRVELNNQGDYRSSVLAQTVNTPEVNDLVVRTYLQRADDRRSTLVFAIDLAHVDDLVRTFRRVGIDARSISSRMKGQDRMRIIEEFQDGQFPVLVNCEVLTEGTDIREIDCIVLARPTKSKNLLAQMVGRGLRLSPETSKEDCYLIDIVDNISRSSGMTVAPTLFGLSHEELELQRSEKEAAEPAPRDEAWSPSPGQTTERQHDFKVTMIDSLDPFGLETGVKKPLARMTNNAWVSCGGGKYILEMMGIGHLTISTSGDGLKSITFTPKLPAELRGRSPFARRQAIAQAENLERAVETADKFAEKRAGPEVSKQLSRYASWRQRPASPKQVQLLLKMKGVDASGPGAREVVILGKTVAASSLKAGEIAAFIAAAQHGALSERDKVDRAAARVRKKAQAKEDKENAAQARNLPLPPVQ